MGGSVNLQNGGSYSMPNIEGYGQRVAGYGQGAANYGTTAPGYGARYGMGNYGMPEVYDGGYGDFGGQYPGVSTGGKGFQQPSYQPAPVLSPYTTSPELSYDTSTGGKGFQTRQTPAESVAYAPMNIPQMQLAQPAFYYPNIGSQMANLNANYGIGGLGAMGAFGNYPMIPRPQPQMQAYPALTAPPAYRPPTPTSTGGKGMTTQPPQQPPPPPPTPGYPPVGTGGKGFVPNQPDIAYPDYTGPDYSAPDTDQILRPVRPEDYGRDFRGPGYGTNVPEPMPQYQDIYTTMPVRDRYDLVEPAVELPSQNVEQVLPTEDREIIEPFMGLDQRNLID